MENTLKTKRWKIALEKAFRLHLKLLEIVRQSIEGTRATELKTALGPVSRKSR